MFSFSASFRGGRGGSAVNRRRGLKNFSPSCQLLLLERQNRCVQRPVSSSFSTRLNPPGALGSEGEERVRSCFSGFTAEQGRRAARANLSWTGLRGVPGSPASRSTRRLGQ